MPYTADRRRIQTLLLSLLEESLDAGWIDEAGYLRATATVEARTEDVMRVLLRLLDATGRRDAKLSAAVGEMIG